MLLAVLCLIGFIAFRVGAEYPSISNPLFFRNLARPVWTSMYEPIFSETVISRGIFVSLLSKIADSCSHLTDAVVG